MRTPLNVMRLRSFYGQGYTPGQSRYGYVRGGRAHQGWDLAARPGTPIFAISSGQSVRVDKHLWCDAAGGNNDYGLCICLEFIGETGVTKGRKLYAFYGHLSAIYLREGNQIHEGSVIGLTGRTGNANTLPVDQAHLHFEIREVPKPGKRLGLHIDPKFLFPIPSPENQSRAT
jgi:peptidoglycan LD-endopeptidase LytH